MLLRSLFHKHDRRTDQPTTVVLELLRAAKNHDIFFFVKQPKKCFRLAIFFPLSVVFDVSGDKLYVMIVQIQFSSGDKSARPQLGKSQFVGGNIPKLALIETWWQMYRPTDRSALHCTVHANMAAMNYTELQCSAVHCTAPKCTVFEMDWLNCWFSGRGGTQRIMISRPLQILKLIEANLIEGKYKWNVHKLWNVSEPIYSKLDGVALLIADPPPLKFHQ